MYDEYPPVEIILRENFAVGANTTLTSVQIGPVPTGWVWRISNLGVENANGTAASALVSIQRNGINYPIDRFTTLVAGIPQFATGVTPIPETCLLNVDFGTIQNATDVLHVWLVAIATPLKGAQTFI